MKPLGDTLCRDCYVNKNASFWKSIQKAKAHTKRQEPKKPFITNSRSCTPFRNKVRDSCCSRWFWLSVVLVFMSASIVRHEVMIHGLDANLHSLDTRLTVGLDAMRAEVNAVRAEVQAKFTVSLESAKKGVESLKSTVMEHIQLVSTRLETNRREVMFTFGLLSTKLDDMDRNLFNKLTKIETRVYTLEARFEVLSQLCVKCEKEHTTLAIRFEGQDDKMARMYEVLEAKLSQSQSDDQRRELLLQDLKHFHRHGVRYTGCFTGDTMIQVDGNGLVMPVWNLTSGSEVWDSENQRVATVLWVVAGAEPVGSTLYIVVTQHSNLTVTAAHAMLVRWPGQEWIHIPAKQLGVGMLVKDQASGQEVMILQVQAKSITQPEVVYNLEVDPSGFVRPGIAANRIVTGDLRAQIALAKPV